MPVLSRQQALHGAPFRHSPAKGELPHLCTRRSRLGAWRAPETHGFCLSGKVDVKVSRDYRELFVGSSRPDSNVENVSVAWVDAGAPDNAAYGLSKAQKTALMKLQTATAAPATTSVTAVSLSVAYTFDFASSHPRLLDPDGTLAVGSLLAPQLDATRDQLNERYGTAPRQVAR